MGLPHDYTDRLHCLHDTLPGFSAQKSCKKEKEVLHRRVKEAVLAKGELYKLYLAFILEWVAPRMDMASGRLVFQAFPCLRLQPPSTHCIGKPHTDSSYHHQAGQINFWLPLTTVGGANSLHIESEPGRRTSIPWK
ncbi:uncharacterized protein LOC142358443 [Convolutriloba macropyga]|uniref:uncharacterized protein LOC142358443 n=1 Tax=Convolutriloba macropyga TaxID=536237 RepID=UPI003F51F621